MSGTLPSNLKQQIRDLEREERAVRHDIRALHRAIRHPGAAAPSRKSRGKREREEGKTDGRLPRPAAEKRDLRLARYLQSGGLSASRPQPEDRSVQRNKALFMLAVALVLIYIVLNLLFR